MENTDRDTANTAPQNDWQNAKIDTPEGTSLTDEFAGDQDERYNNEQPEEHIHAMAGIDAPDPDEDEEEETDDESDEDEEEGDWGHVDPAEGNGPFPDPNAPTAPGSAV